MEMLKKHRIKLEKHKTLQTKKTTKCLNILMRNTLQDISKGGL